MTNIGTIQKENKWKTLAIDMLVDLIAGTAFGISVNVFTAPNHIAPGGVTGCDSDELHFWNTDWFDVLPHQRAAAADWC